MMTSSRKRQRGVVAVEAAIVIPVLILLLAAPLYFARYFWHYTTAQKAARDAALYLAKVSQLEMKTTLPSTGDVPAALFASSIVRDELSELNNGGAAPRVVVQCGYQSGSSVSFLPCDGISLPVSVKVTVRMYVTDPFFSGLTAYYAGETGYLIWAEVPVQYVGS